MKKLSPEAIADLDRVTDENLRQLNALGPPSPTDSPEAMALWKEMMKAAGGMGPMRREAGPEDPEPSDPDEEAAFVAEEILRIGDAILRREKPKP